MLLSHKKYNELASGIAGLIQDNETRNQILALVRGVMNYSEERGSYNPAYYEAAKQKKKATNDKSWNEYSKRYYERHREDINERRRANYQKKHAEASI